MYRYIDLTEDLICEEQMGAEFSCLQAQDIIPLFIAISTIKNRIFEEKI